MSIFSTFLELQFWGLKSIRLYPEYQKIFLCAFFCLKRKHMKKRSILWQKPWTNPFAKWRFFSTLWELHFWGPKNFFLYPEYQKMFLYCFFLLKKNIWGKGRFFEKNHGLTPLQNVNFFYFVRTSRFGFEKHFSLSKIK